MDAIFDGADGDFQLGGDFVVLEAPEVHHEGRFVRAVQRLDGLGDVLQRKGRVSLVVRTIISRVDVVQVVGSVDEGFPPHHPLIVGDERILHNRVEPRLQVSTIGIFVAVGEGFQHRVL